MKKGIIIFTAIIIVLISFFIGKSSHDNIKASEVKLITVDKKEYTKENNTIYPVISCGSILKALILNSNK